MGVGVANVACCSGLEELKSRLWTILLNLDMSSSNSAQHARLSTSLCVTVCFRGGKNKILDPNFFLQPGQKDKRNFLKKWSKTLTLAAVVVEAIHPPLYEVATSN